MAAYESDGGGIGGKFQKRPFRRAPATPYDRPQAAARPAQPLPAEPRGNGWLSRLVDPATRIISWSASRLFPSSVFQKRLGAPPATPPGLVPPCTFAHVLRCPLLHLSIRLDFKDVHEFIVSCRCNMHLMYYPIDFIVITALFLQRQIRDQWRKSSKNLLLASALIVFFIFVKLNVLLTDCFHFPITRQFFLDLC
ncbi:unnamed protein product [Musa textilis]